MELQWNKPVHPATRCQHPHGATNTTNMTNSSPLVSTVFLLRLYDDELLRNYACIIQGAFEVIFTGVLFSPDRMCYQLVLQLSKSLPTSLAAKRPPSRGMQGNPRANLLDLSGSHQRR